ncbi:MAG: D-aminoacyl-tRNA deacylase [Lachnospiraceae bacterium]
MKFVIQRVTEASVEVDEKIIGEIANGYLVLIGVGQEDTTAEADRLIKKMINLRIFSDENGKTNLSLKDVNGGLLLVSQFTLYANCKYMATVLPLTEAGDPKRPRSLYEYIIAECRRQIPVVQTGSFGADMKVRLCNDGPFQSLLES